MGACIGRRRVTHVGVTDGQTSVGCQAHAAERGYMKDIKHRTKVAPKIHTWNQFTESLGAKIHQLCISSYQQVLCVRVYGRTAGTAEAALQLPAEEAGWGLCSYPLLCHLPCACCRVELSVFQGGNSSKDGNTLTLTPAEKRQGGCLFFSITSPRPLSPNAWPGSGSFLVAPCWGWLCCKVSKHLLLLVGCFICQFV